MTLTEAVRSAMAEWSGTNLSSELRLGRTNQVDFAGRSSAQGEVRVELERRREDPVNNVVKAWRQATENEPAFTLVHVFSGFYLSKKAKFENARFVGQMMNQWGQAVNRNIKYVAVLLDFEPPMGDADPMIDATVAEAVRAQIARQLASNAR